VDALDAIYRLSQVPTILGWALMTGGIAALTFLAGLIAGRRQ
jgi:hypothetical protein